MEGLGNVYSFPGFDVLHGAEPDVGKEVRSSTRDPPFRGEAATLEPIFLAT